MISSSQQVNQEWCWRSPVLSNIHWAPYEDVPGQKTAHLRDLVIKSDDWVVKYFRVGLYNWPHWSAGLPGSSKFILVINLVSSLVL